VTRIQIYKKTKRKGETIKTPLEIKTFESERALRGFMAYWFMQCDTRKYGYEILPDEVTP
jgi:hypothetical protein